LLKVEEFEDKLVIRENSNKFWIFVVLLFVSIWTWNAFSFDVIVFGIWGVLSIIFVLFSLLMATNDEVVIDRKAGEITINRKGFFSFSTEYRIYKFDALAETIEFEKRRVGRSESYFAYVETLDNKKVELFDSGNSSEEKFFTLFKLCNQYFIGLSGKDFQLPII
jgi:hypothetical protein